jgi:hypothetical protein
MAAKRTTTTEKNAPAARKPALRRRKKAITHEQIAQHAYFLSLQGFADPLANWLQAERELVGA